MSLFTRNFHCHISVKLILFTKENKKQNSEIHFTNSNEPQLFLQNLTQINSMKTMGKLRFQLQNK